MKLPWSQSKTAAQVADVITKKAEAEVSCDEFGNRFNQSKIEPKAVLEYAAALEELASPTRTR